MNFTNGAHQRYVRSMGAFRTFKVTDGNDRDSPEAVVPATASIAREIVTGSGMAPLRPAVLAPVIDETESAYVGLEPLGLAHWGVGGVPYRWQVAGARETALEGVFIGFVRAF